MKLRSLIKESLDGKDYEKLNLQEDPFYTTIKNPMNSFVGRQDELKQLARALSGMAKGNSDYVAVLGNHGIGKTHFLYIFNRLIEDESLLKQLAFDYSAQFFRNDVVFSMLVKVSF